MFGLPERETLAVTYGHADTRSNRISWLSADTWEFGAHRMSIPFVPSVAAGAVEVATDPELIGSGRRSMLAALQSRFPDQHPLLIGEHLDYAERLVRSALDRAADVSGRSVRKADALAGLRRGYPSFPGPSLERALDFGLDALHSRL